MQRMFKVLAVSAAFTIGICEGVSAAPITFTAQLSGANESPANASAGTGFATVTFDTAAHSMSVAVSFSGLTGTTTASHIHCCTTVPFNGTAGVATTTPTFAGFPLGATSGTYSMSFDMTQASSYNPAFVTAEGSISAAEAALFDGMLSGNDYLNIHTTFAPGGEIRGFLRQVPEPAGLGLLLLGIGGLTLLLRQPVREAFPGRRA